MLAYFNPQSSETVQVYPGRCHAVHSAIAEDIPLAAAEIVEV